MYCKMILTSFMGHWQGIPYFLNSGGHFILESKAQASSYVHEPTSSTQGTSTQNKTFFFRVKSTYRPKIMLIDYNRVWITIRKQL